MPWSLASAMARSIASAWPEITTCVGSLSLAISQTSRVFAGVMAAASASAVALWISAPSSAAIAPIPTGIASCMASPRSLSRRAVSPRVKALIAHSAVYSPSEWPATQAAFSASSTPNSRSSTRRVAMALAMIAGCALAVSVSWSSGPSRMIAESFCASASSTSSKTSRACALASARSAPMPIFWLPWPGKMNALMPVLLWGQGPYAAPAGSTRPKGTIRLSALCPIRARPK